MLLLHDEDQIGRYFMTSLGVIEEAELLCTAVSDTSTDVNILPQAPVSRLCLGASRRPDGLKQRLLDNA
jgi:hypothetical protein